MMNEQASHRYYLANHGLWRGAFDFRVTDWGAFWRARVSLMDRLRVLSMWFLPKLIGAFRMETLLDYRSFGPTENKVLHETRVVKWGMVMMDSHEVFQLDEDGTRVHITGKQWIWPNMWWPKPLEGSSATIDEAAEVGRYTFSWFGGKLRQQVEITDAGVTVTQQMDWFEGVQRLERYSETTPPPRA